MNDPCRAVLLSADGEIIAWCDPASYFTGLTLESHSTMGNDCMLAVERYIAARQDAPMHVVWATKYSTKSAPKASTVAGERKTDMTSVREALDKVVSDAKQVKKLGIDLDDDDTKLIQLADDAKYVIQKADFSKPPTEKTLVTINLCLDYALRKSQERNLYELCDDVEGLHIGDEEITMALMNYKRNAVTHLAHRYIVNHTKKLFIDKADANGSWHRYQMNPIPILTHERGGEWTGDHISVCSEKPSGDEYTEYQNPLFATELFSESIADAFVNRAGNQSR